MIIVTSIKNPFIPDENIKNIYEFVDGKPLSFYIFHIDLSNEDINFTIGLNGKNIDIKDINRTKISDGDMIAVCAKVEYTVAGIVAKAVATYIWGTAFSTAVYYAITYAVVYAATIVAIGYGLSRLASALGPDAPKLTEASTSDSTTEQAYGWGSLRQTSQEGISIPYVFGTVKISGNVINQYVSVEDQKEILNILIGICDHELASISDIRLDDRAASSYRDVLTDYRLGTNDDTAISGFGEVVTQNAIGSTLIEDSAVVIHTDGDLVEKIRIFLTAPRGLYYSNDTGGLSARTAIVKIEYRTLEIVPGSWLLHSEETMSAATTAPQRYTFDIDGLLPDQYEVQITRTNAAETSHRGSSEISFTLFQEIVKEELIYPGLAKYSIKALATEQLSGGVPSITCLATSNNLNIYNEDTGFWETKRATNPAWIVYYLLTNFAEVDVSKIIYEDFLGWAEYCDYDGIEGSTYRFEINIMVYDGNFWEQAQKISKYGRATIVRRGVRYGVFVDKEEDIVSDMFTTGNIIENSFKLQYLARKDRASAVEIEYTDKDRNYTRQVITIYSDNYLDGNDIAQKANVKIQAAISQKEAVREGVYRINGNQLLNRIITFEAFIDSFACIVGDLFYFQHSIPDYSISNGGRILDAGNYDSNGDPYIEIDTGFIIEDGEFYAILVRLRDNSIVEKLINEATNGYTNLVLYSEELDITKNEWTGASITTTQNITIAPDGKLTADKIIETVEHGYHQIYQELQAGDIEAINFSGYVKAAEHGDNILITIYSDGFAANVTVNLSEESISGNSSELTNEGDGWYRFSVDGEILTGEPYLLSVYIDADIYLGDGVSGLYVWGLQATEGGSLYPYIKTETTTSTIASIFSLTSSWSSVPVINIEELPIYNIGIISNYKKTYRLLAVTRSDSMTRELTAIEYIPEIYTNNDDFIIEEQDLEETVQQATHLIVEESLIFDKDGNYQSQLSISWNSLYNKGLEWVVWLEDITAGTAPVKQMTTGLNAIYISGSFLIAYHEYKILINTVNEGPIDLFYNTSTVTISGTDLLPDNVTAFYLQNNSLVWTYPGNKLEIVGFKIKAGIGTNINWDSADFLNSGGYVTSPHTIEITGSSITYLIKAYNADGNESDSAAAVLINLGDIIINNVVEEEIVAPLFDGDITGGSVTADVLYSDSMSEFWTAVDETVIWTGYPGNDFWETHYSEMIYIERFTPHYFGVDVVIDVTATASAGMLKYYREVQNTIFMSGNDAAAFTTGNADEQFWDVDTHGEYKLIPAKVILYNHEYDVKVIINSATAPTNISEIKLIYDYPDIIESFEDIVIDSGGTRLSLTKDFTVIKNVGLTLQDDGSTATSLIIVDKNVTLGPMIYAEDSTRSRVTATIDALVQGY